VNKCGPDVDIAAIKAFVWLWERSKLSGEEAFAIEEDFPNPCGAKLLYRVIKLPILAGVEDFPEAESLGLGFHRGSLTFIPKNPYGRVNYSCVTAFIIDAYRNEGER